MLSRMNRFFVTSSRVEAPPVFPRASMNASASHLDGGDYAFNKALLQWSTKDLPEKEYALSPLKELPQTFRSLTEYYDLLLPLIMAECWSMLKQGIEKKPQQFILELTKPPKFSGNIDNPSSFIGNGRLPREIKQFASGIVLLLHIDAERCLGITSIEKSTSRSLRVKFLATPTMRRNLSTINSSKPLTISAFMLGAITTQRRMYKICIEKPVSKLLQAALVGDLAQKEFTRAPTYIDQESDLKLNKSQHDAINQFTRIKQGIALLQGPPGTGKTTTIVGLLRRLAGIRDGRATLVCAPSNKAIHVIAERFYTAMPSTPMIIVGVEEKLPDKLRPIFLHTWLSEIRKKLLRAKSFLLRKVKLSAMQQASQVKNMTKLISEVKADIDKILPVCGGTNFRMLMLQCLTAVQSFSVSTQSKLESQIEDIITRLNAKSDAIEEQLLKNACVVFSTLSVAGRKMMDDLSVRDLIVDEAAQSVEAAAMIPFRFNPPRCMVVGDHRQLQATVISEQAGRLGFKRSMMDRLAGFPGQIVGMLTTQYRMAPKISDWPSKTFYEGRLRNGPNTITRKALLAKTVPKVINRARVFINVDGREAKDSDSFSRYNKQEIFAVKALVNYLRDTAKINKPGAIGVITFYSAQMKRLRASLHKDVHVSTVDGFQGEENDIIIISCVVANRSGNIGFLGDPRRVNVAITRARYHLYIVGDEETLVKKDSHIASLVKNCDEEKHVISLSELQNALSIKKVSAKQGKKKPVVRRQTTSRKTQVCRLFKPATPGSCRYGAKCKFSHPGSPGG